MLVLRASHARQFTLHTRWLLVVRASHARQFTLRTRWLVGGTSVACMPDNLRYIHGGCWWYERRMPDNLHYVHGIWLMVRASHARQITLHTRCLVSRMPDNLLYKHGSYCQLDRRAAGELMASNEDRLRHR